MNDVVSSLDRGLHFGDGLFETIACRHGRARFLSLHLERLATGCERLSIATPDLTQLHDEVTQMAAAHASSLVKVIVTRGVATSRGYAPSGKEETTRVILRYDWPVENPSWAKEGVTVRIGTLQLGENPALAGLKHLSRLEQVLARKEWSDPAIAESLLFSSSGALVSGTMTNVFLVQGGQVRTPRVDRCGVAGIMRRVVLREAARAGIVAEECVLTRTDLERADEILLTNARIGIWPVRQLSERTLAQGVLTPRLQTLIGPFMEEQSDVEEAASKAQDPKQVRRE